MGESNLSVDDAIQALFSDASKLGDKRPIDIPPISSDSCKTEKDEAFSIMMKTLSTSEALDKDDVKRCVRFFKNLYCTSENDDSGYRHSYTSILEAMIGDFDPDSTRPDYTVSFTTENLSNNVGLIQAVIEEGDNEQLTRKFKKLVDHVSLEYKRLNYITRQNKLQYESSDGSAKRLQRDLQHYTDRYRYSFAELDKRIAEKEEQIDKLQRDYIAILGIFAAVVIFANGGIVFSTSSLQAIAGQNIAYVAFIVSLVGGFIFNILYALFAFIYRIAKNSQDNWAVISKRTFIKINTVIVFTIGFLFVASVLMTFIEHQWAIVS